MSKKAGPNSWERLNPLCCDGFSLSPNQLVAAKLLALYWVQYRLNYGFPPPFLPWIPGLDAPALATIWSPLLLATYLTATLALCLNRAPRTAAGVCSGIILLQVASGVNQYANSTIFTGLLLGYLALQTRERGSWMIRAQLVVVYIGAALNKALHPDWQSGQYIMFWTSDVMQIDWFVALGEATDGSLYTWFSWFVIAAEFAMAGLIAFPRTLPGAALFAVAFHGGMLFFTEGRISWVFAYAVPTALLTLWKWPEPLRRPDWSFLDNGPGRTLARLVWPGSEPSSDGSHRATPFWRWPICYAGLCVAFFIATRCWKTAKEMVPINDLF